MRKPVNSEIDLIRAIFTKSNDILLEAKAKPTKFKEVDLFGNPIAAAVPPAAVPPAAVPPAPPAVPAAPIMPNWSTLHAQAMSADPTLTYNAATQQIFNKSNLNPNISTQAQRDDILKWHQNNIPASTHAAEIADQFRAAALDKSVKATGQLEAEKAHGERLAAILTPDPNIAARARLTSETEANRIQVGTEDLASTIADRPAAIAAQTAQTIADRNQAAAAQRTSASAIRIADAIRPGNEADAIAGAANTNANNASARNTQGLARDFADAKTARGRSSFGQENAIADKTEKNIRTDNEQRAARDEAILADRAKPWWKRKDTLRIAGGIGVGAVATALLGPTMMLPGAAAGALLGNYISKRLREDYQVILEQRLFEATKKKVILTPAQIASMQNRGIGVSTTGSGDATKSEIENRIAAAATAAVAKAVAAPVAPVAAPVVPVKSEEDLADEAEMAAWRQKNPSVLADLRNDISAAQPTKRTVGLEDVVDDAGETVATIKTKGTPKRAKKTDTTVKIGAVDAEPPEEKQLLDTLFKKTDKNKSGAVSKRELGTILPALAAKPAAKPTGEVIPVEPETDDSYINPLTSDEISQANSVIQGAEGGFSPSSRGKRVPVINTSAYVSSEDPSTWARRLNTASDNVRWPFSKDSFVPDSYTPSAPADVKPKTSSLDLDPYRNSTKKSDALTPQIRNADGSLSPQFPLIRNGSPEWLAWNKAKDQKRIDAGLPLTIRKSKGKTEKTNTERGPDAQGNKFIQGMTDVHRDENNNPITSERFPQGIEQSNAGLHFYPNNPTARFHLDSLIAKASPGSVRNRNAKPKDEVLGVGGGEESLFIPHLPLGKHDRGTGEIIAAPHSENINLIDPSTIEHSDYLASLVKPVVTTDPSQEISDSQESGTLGDDPTKYYTNPGSIPLEKQKRRKGYSPVSREDAAVKLSQALRDVTSLRPDEDKGYVNW